MKTKTVYSYDPISRAYMRSITLDEGDMSPLDLAEGRDVWLIPGNCLEFAPPPPDKVPGGQFVREHLGQWEFADIPALPEPDPVGTNPSVPKPEADLKGRAQLLREAVQNYMDQTAAAFGYDDIKTAVTYAEEKSVAKFWAEGRMFRAWRSKLWAKCYALLAQVEALEIEEPQGFEDLAPMLPALDTQKAIAEQAALEAEQAAEAEAEAAAEAAAHAAEHVEPDAAPEA